MDPFRMFALLLFLAEVADGEVASMAIIMTGATPRAVCLTEVKAMDLFMGVVRRRRLAREIRP